MKREYMWIEIGVMIEAYPDHIQLPFQFLVSQDCIQRSIHSRSYTECSSIVLKDCEEREMRDVLFHPTRPLIFCSSDGE
jgi:hypothetical protein